MSKSLVTSILLNLKYFVKHFVHLVLMTVRDRAICKYWVELGTKDHSLMASEKLRIFGFLPPSWKLLEMENVVYLKFS